jgi:hypothetical protein
MPQPKKRLKVLKFNNLSILLQPLITLSAWQIKAQNLSVLLSLEVKFGAYTSLNISYSPIHRDKPSSQGQKKYF